MDLERKTSKWSVDEHIRGVYGFDVCRTYNFIASCGVERSILMWNPFTGRSVGALHGHAASIQVSQADSTMLVVKVPAGMARG